MVFHELATNAAKYGALLVPAEWVAVSWRLNGLLHETTLSISWREIGGPPVSSPSRTGFGTRLIKRSLQGAVSLDFAVEGLRCDIELLLSEPSEAVQAV